MAATAAGATDVAFRKHTPEALKRFTRSVELCDDYLRGYYGLKLVSSPIPELYYRPNRCARLRQDC
jgi:ER membrane protein complex subunit 2